MTHAWVGGGAGESTGVIKPNRLDYYAGGLVMLLGIGAAYTGSGYEMGSLTRMGPGFFPTALGVLLAFVGVLIAGSASFGEADEVHATSTPPDWRGWICIIAGALLFVLFASHGGLLLATFSCVFVAAMGDRTNTWKQAALLAAGVTVFGIVVFAYGLRVQIPIVGF
ncbi:MAG: tripartite tricarboxylate transporter TctB [Rhodospirillales bacterium]|nr:tripartite tricarboxylate transporter TctB [Rhodospirillales bacterium]